MIFYFYTCFGSDYYGYQYYKSSANGVEQLGLLRRLGK